MLSVILLFLFEVTYKWLVCLFRMHFNQQGVLITVSIKMCHEDKFVFLMWTVGVSSPQLVVFAGVDVPQVLFAVSISLISGTF